MKTTKRKHNTALKVEVALEAIKGIKTASEIAHEHQIHPVQVAQWKKDFLERSTTVFDGDRKLMEENKLLKEERDEAHRQIGKLKVENDWYKKKLQ